MVAAAGFDPHPAFVPGNGGGTWMGDREPIVVLDGETASFRVGIDIAAAARRTPDAAASTLGPEWVAFRPSTLDGHARDRIAAWFAAAHRRMWP